MDLDFYCKDKFCVILTINILLWRFKVEISHDFWEMISLINEVYLYKLLFIIFLSNILPRCYMMHL